MGIVYPASTDLVKDGATAMGTISTTVDAKTGLVLLNTTSFTTQTSVSVSDVFSTNYTNYRILGKATMTSIAAFRMRLRVSGADDTNAVYASAYNFVDPGSGTGGNGTNAASYYSINSDANTNEISFIIDCMYPNVVDETRINFQASWSGYGTGAPYFNHGGGVFKNTTAFTGFTILPSTSNITGDVSVYGYNK
jgi:hypothetical protein